MRKLKCILIICFLFKGISAHVQPYETNKDYFRTSQWIFGDNNHVQFVKNNQSDSFLINSIEASAVFTNTDGKMVLYTDGVTVWDSSNNIVTNGLIGNNSSSMGAVFSYSEKDSIVLLFHTNYSLSTNKEFAYSKFKLSNNSIKLISKNNILNTQISEPIALINSADNINKWVICHGFDNNLFYAYHITDGEISNCAEVSAAGSVNGGSAFASQFDLKFSNNGEYLLKSNLNVPINQNGVEIFKFDRNSGKIQKVFYIPGLTYPVIGVVFSPNNKNIFICERDKDLNIYKFFPNDSALTIQSRKKIKIDGIKLEMQNTIDNRIAFGVLDSNYLTVINYPDNYVNYNLQIKGIQVKNLTNNGLPNFNQSYFYTPSIDFTYNYDCISNTIKFDGRDTFSAISHNWQIKKTGKAIEATYLTKNITHAFFDTGNYEIRYIAIKGARMDTIIKSITLYPRISRSFLGKDTSYAVGTSFSRILKAPSGMHCYNWQDSSSFSTFTADTTGVFISTITSQSFCAISDTVIITECINDLIVPIISRSRDSLYVAHQLADSFIWYKNNNLYKITKVPFLALTDTGVYRVEAAKKGHCNRSSANFDINKLNIHLISHLGNDIKVFPNPSNDDINIVFSQFGDYNICIYNSLGQKIYEGNTNANINISLLRFPAGVYSVQIINLKQQQFNTIILKE